MGRKWYSQIGIRHIVIAANESARFKMIAGTDSSPSKQPLQTNPWLPPPTQCGVQADRLFTAILNINFRVVFQGLAHTRQVLHHFNPEGLQSFCGTDSRQLQKLRRVDGSATAQDFSSSQTSIRPFSTTSTPTARLPSNTIRRTSTPQRTSKFGRLRDRMQIALAAFHRRLRHVVRSNRPNPPC